MILLVAIAGGLLAGYGWARWRRRPYQVPALRSTWLILVGFIPQLIVAFVPATRSLVPDWLAGLGLSASLIAFLAFVWINRRLPGMPILLVGLVLNLVVTVANRGWMPISPEVASRVVGEDVSKYAAAGVRFGQKDILLPLQDIRLEFLADRFLLPTGPSHAVAFSAGDILIAAGAFLLLAKPPAKPTLLQAE